MHDDDGVDATHETFGDEIFRQLIEAAPDAMIVLEPGGTIVFVNVQAESLFDYKRTELVGRPLETLIPERLRDGHSAHRTRFFEQPQPRPMGMGLDLQARRRDSSEFPVEISLSPLQTARGRLVCAAIRDVTERKKIQATADRANRYLRNAVESIQEAFALFDEAGGLVLCNSSYRLLLGRAIEGDINGRTRVQILDANLSSGLFELGAEEPSNFRARFLEYHDDPRGEFEFRMQGGQVFRMFERRTADGGIVSTTWEITADMRREMDLREAQRSAEEANAAKSEFLASMSHELRTPLNAVLGFAQLLQRDKKTPLTERQQERLSYVVKGGEHLLRLIDDVLDLSRIESGRIPVSLEPVSLGEVLEDVKLTLDPIASRQSIGLAIEALPEALPKLMADRTRLVQVLMNFGSNAVKYGKSGGHVAFGAKLEDHRVVITVVDDGMGIPPDKQSKLFEPFQRAGQETGPIEGTGIGLTISKRLIEVMGGSIGFSSQLGQGSTFWIALPAASSAVLLADRDASVPSVGLSLGEQGAKKHVIVFVEDNPANIAFMEDLLGDFESIQLITAPTGEIGLELIRAHLPEVVLLDINLPGISGIEVAKRLREWPETCAIPLVALSAAAMIRDAQRIKEAGFYRYLTKPVRVDELTAVLEEILAKSARAD